MFMINTVNKIISSIKLNPNFLVFKKFYLAFLRNFFKLQIRLLHAVSESKILYYIYIFLIIYGVFGCKGNVNYTTSQYVAFIIVLYFMGTSLQLYILCNTSITRTFKTVYGPEADKWDEQIKVKYLTQHVANLKDINAGLITMVAHKFHI